MEYRATRDQGHASAPADPRGRHTAWHLRDGDGARPYLATCPKRLHQHMLQLVETYERLVDLDSRRSHQRHEARSSASFIA